MTTIRLTTTPSAVLRDAHARAARVEPGESRWDAMARVIDEWGYRIVSKDEPASAPAHTRWHPDVLVTAARALARSVTETFDREKNPDVFALVDQVMGAIPEPWDQNTDRVRLVLRGSRGSVAWGAILDPSESPEDPPTVAITEDDAAEIEQRVRGEFWREVATLTGTLGGGGDVYVAATATAVLNCLRGVRAGAIQVGAAVPPPPRRCRCAAQDGIPHAQWCPEWPAPHATTGDVMVELLEGLRAAIERAEGRIQ